MKSRFRDRLVMSIAMVGALAACDRQPSPQDPTNNIHLAVLRGDVEVVRALLKRDPALARSVDGFGSTPLHAAAGIGNRAMVELLLASGADPTAKGPAGKTPGEVAASHGYKELVALLSTKVSASRNSPNP